MISRWPSYSPGACTPSSGRGRKCWFIALRLEQLPFHRKEVGYPEPGGAGDDPSFDRQVVHVLQPEQGPRGVCGTLRGLSRGGVQVLQQAVPLPAPGAMLSLLPHPCDPWPLPGATRFPAPVEEPEQAGSQATKPSASATLP